MPAARHVVVDGSNIATEGNSLPSLKQLDEAVREYLHENPDDLVTVVVDATFGHRIPPEELELFEQAEREGDIVSPPAGAIGRGDAFLLRVADKVGAVVLSNDSFQEFHGEYGWLFDKGRLIGGKPVPGVGWIFTPRSPVRGPKSRQAIKEAQRKRDAEPTEPEGSGLELAAERSRGKAGGRKVQRAIATATEEAEVPERDARKRRRRRRAGEPPAEPLNDPLTFISFIAAHRLGEEVEGVIEEFSSHGAFISASSARCYVPLSAMGDPPPRSAREVLSKGEPHAFVVQAFDAMRRGIELALPGYAHPSGAPTPETVDAEIHVADELREPAPGPTAGHDAVAPAATPKAARSDGTRRRRRGEEALAGQRGGGEGGDHDGYAFGPVGVPMGESAGESAPTAGTGRRGPSRARGAKAAAAGGAGASETFPAVAPTTQAELPQVTGPARAPKGAKAAPAKAASRPPTAEPVPTAEHVKEVSAPRAAAKVGAPGRKAAQNDAAAPTLASAAKAAKTAKTRGKSKATPTETGAVKEARSKKGGAGTEAAAKAAATTDKAAKASTKGKAAANTQVAGTKRAVKATATTRKAAASEKPATKEPAAKKGSRAAKAALSGPNAVAKRVTGARTEKGALVDAEEGRATTRPRKAVTTRLAKTAVPGRPSNRGDGLPSDARTRPRAADLHP